MVKGDVGTLRIIVLRFFTQSDTHSEGRRISQALYLTRHRRCRRRRLLSTGESVMCARVHNAYTYVCMRFLLFNSPIYR